MMSFLFGRLAVALIAPHTKGPLQAAGASSDPPPDSVMVPRREQAPQPFPRKEKTGGQLLTE